MHLGNSHLSVGPEFVRVIVVMGIFQDVRVFEALLIKNVRAFF